MSVGRVQRKEDVKEDCDGEDGRYSFVSTNDSRGSGPNRACCSGVQ